MDHQIDILLSSLLKTKDLVEGSSGIELFLLKGLFDEIEK